MLKLPKRCFVASSKKSTSQKPILLKWPKVTVLTVSCHRRYFSHVADQWKRNFGPLDSRPCLCSFPFFSRSIESCLPIVCPLSACLPVRLPEPWRATALKLTAINCYILKTSSSWFLIGKAASPQLSALRP